MVTEEVAATQRADANVSDGGARPTHAAGSGGRAGGTSETEEPVLMARRKLIHGF